MYNPCSCSNNTKPYTKTVDLRLLDFNLQIRHIVHEYKSY